MRRFRARLQAAGRSPAHHDPSDRGRESQLRPDARRPQPGRHPRVPDARGPRRHRSPRARGSPTSSPSTPRSAACHWHSFSISKSTEASARPVGVSAAPRRRRRNLSPSGTRPRRPKASSKPTGLRSCVGPSGTPAVRVVGHEPTSRGGPKRCGRADLGKQPGRRLRSDRLWDRRVMGQRTRHSGRDRCRWWSPRRRQRLPGTGLHTRQSHCRPHQSGCRHRGDDRPAAVDRAAVAVAS